VLEESWLKVSEVATMVIVGSPSSLSLKSHLCLGISHLKWGFGR
jgi:hypothetical protein